MDVYNGWCSTSEQFRKNSDSSLDCEYGTGDRDRLDLFRCGDSDAPLILFIHGGYWQRGDKSAYSFIADPFTQTNVNVALVGYQLCPESSMTGILSSIQQAVLWLWKNAESYGVSAERLNLCGHSAGGHLTAMALATDWTALDHDVPRDIIKTGIPISGLFQLEPLRRTTIGDVLGLDDDESRQLSPCFFQPATNAPVLVIVGGAETDQFHWQTDQFFEQWSKNDLIMDRHVEPGADHFDIINRFASNRSELFHHVLHWLK